MDLTPVRMPSKQQQRHECQGPGGVGKTRLSLKLMTESAHDYEDGARLAELETLTEPDLVVHATASALGLADQTGLPLLETRKFSPPAQVR